MNNTVIIDGLNVTEELAALRAENEKLRAERDELKKQFDICHNDRCAKWKERDQARELLLEAEDALVFYADGEEWTDFKEYGIDRRGIRRRVDSHFDTDEGKRAREALQKLRAAREGGA